MRPHLILTSVLTTAALVGLSGCGDDAAGGADTGTNETTANETADQGEAPDGKSEEAPREDLRITACDGTAGVTATLEVTSSLDTPMEYHGTILFKDASGATIDEGLYNTGTIDPGETVTEEIPGAVYEAVPGLTCELGEAELDEPE